MAKENSLEERKTFWKMSELDDYHNNHGPFLFEDTNNYKVGLLKKVIYTFLNAKISFVLFLVCVSSVVSIIVSFFDPAVAAELGLGVVGSIVALGIAAAIGYVCYLMISAAVGDLENGTLNGVAVSKDHVLLYFGALDVWQIFDQTKFNFYEVKKNCVKLISKTSTGMIKEIDEFPRIADPQSFGENLQSVFGMKENK